MTRYGSIAMAAVPTHERPTLRPGQLPRPSAPVTVGAGTAHGGFLATIADVILGYNINHRIPKEWRIATSNLSVQFFAPARPGQWLEGKLDRVKIGKRLCHASGTLDIEGVPIVAMQAIFAVLSDAR